MDTQDTHDGQGTQNGQNGQNESNERGIEDALLKRYKMDGMIDHDISKEEKKCYQTYKIKERICKYAEECISELLLAGCIPEKIETTDEFVEGLKNAIIENEYHEMYEFIRKCQSHYLREDFPVGWVAHEILLNSKYGGNSYILEEEKSEWEIFKKSKCREDIDYEEEEELFEEENDKEFNMIIGRINSRMPAKKIIYPYYEFLFREDYDCVVKNYSKIFMEVYCPHKGNMEELWINPSKMIYGKPDLSIKKLITQVEEEYINSSSQTDESGESGEEAKHKRSSLLEKMDSFLLLYNNVLCEEYPEYFNTKKLWVDDKLLEEYLLEKIIGLDYAMSLLNLDYSQDVTVTISNILSPLSCFPFNELHSFLIKNVIEPYISNELVEYTMNSAQLNPLCRYVDEESIKEEYNKEYVKLGIFFLHLLELLREMHATLMREFLKYLKSLKTIERRKNYFERMQKPKYNPKRIKRFKIDPKWKGILDITDKNKRVLLAVLLYQKIYSCSNAEFFNHENNKVQHFNSEKNARALYGNISYYLYSADCMEDNFDWRMRIIWSNLCKNGIIDKELIETLTVDEVQDYLSTVCDNLLE